MLICKDGVNTMRQHTENSSSLLDGAQSLINGKQADTAPPQAANRVCTCMHAASPLTFSVGFQVSVNGRRLTVTEDGPAGRSLGTGAEAHVSRWGDLLTQRRELHGARGHRNVIGFVHWLRQTARVMMGGRIGAHGDIVLLEFFCGLSTHWHHSFGFLNGWKKGTCQVHWPGTEWGINYSLAKAICSQDLQYIKDTICE